MCAEGGALQLHGHHESRSLWGCVPGSLAGLLCHLDSGCADSRPGVYVAAMPVKAEAVGSLAKKAYRLPAHRASTVGREVRTQN